MADQAAAMARGAEAMEQIRIQTERLLWDATPPDRMLANQEHFLTKQVVKVVERVYVALGYGMANSIWLSAPEGIIVVDTTESMESAQEVLTVMRTVLQGPIRGVIYTHSHIDHVRGTKVFVEDSDSPPEIWAHAQFEWELDNVATVAPAHAIRSLRQFGSLLPEGVKSGFGHRLRMGAMSNGLVMPTHVMKGEEQEVNIAGMSLTLVHIPGETEDQIGVWLPEVRTFICADDLYKAFPNLYAIRGTPLRNARKWINSLDRMRKLKPQYLVPCHGTPISGEESVYEVLTAYRDALQYVHDQTVRYMNKGMHPQDIVGHIRLPDALAKDSYLQELYGTVEWSSRSVFDQYMGWFSGEAAELGTLNKVERARGMVELAGGPEGLYEAARKALDEGRSRWALELASHLLVNQPEDTKALEIRTAALKATAAETVSPQGRHYYLTTALEDHGIIKGDRITKTAVTNAANTMTINQLFILLKTHLIPGKAEGIKLKVVFHFTDIGETWVSQLRNCILEVTKETNPADYDIKVVTSSVLWRKILVGKENPKNICANGFNTVEGDKAKFETFIGCFEL